MQIIIICKSRNLIENTNYYCTIFIDNIPTDIANMQQQKPPQPNITKSSASANAIVELKIQQTANRTSRKKSLSNMNEMANGKLVSIKKIINVQKRRRDIQIFVSCIVCKLAHSFSPDGFIKR